MVKLLTFKWVKEGYRSKFPPERVNTFYRMARRHSTVPFEAICITDDPAGIDPSISTYPLWANPVPDYGGGNDPNCFVRLPLLGAKMRRIFGRNWWWSDLDALIAGNIDHVHEDDAPFRIWRPDGGRSKCNGSLVSSRGAGRPELWDSFRPETVGSVAEFRAKTMHLGSDQAWIASNLTENDQFFDSTHGIYAFRSLRNPHRERALGKMRRISIRDSLPQAIKVRDLARRTKLNARVLDREPERMETKLPKNVAIVYFPGQQHPWDESVQSVYPWVGEHYK